MNASFGERLRRTLDRFGPLCVGVDPHDWLLEQYGLERSAAGAAAFARLVLAAAVGRAGILKPQVAFFERFGAEGIAVLQEHLREARAAGLLVIADAKRGDIGSTQAAYAEAWLADGAPLEADALTVSAYLGVGALAGTFDTAHRHGKGVFVLAATSNPEAHGLQTARGAGGEPVALSVARQVHEAARSRIAAGAPESSAAAAGSGPAWADFGLVVGATVDPADYGLDTPELAEPPVLPVLAPGYGYQGVPVSGFGADGGLLPRSTIAALSRDILKQGPHGLADAVADTAQILKDARDHATDPSS